MKYQVIGRSESTEEFITFSFEASDESEVRKIAAENWIATEYIIRLANPLLEQQAKWYCDIYSEFLEKMSRWRKDHFESIEQVTNKACSISISDIETTYYTKRSGIVATIEQIQLSNGEVGRRFPFAEYLTRQDQRVRTTHGLMNGFVALRSWEGWARIRPPCGWRCRCCLKFISDFEAVKRGFMTEEGTPTLEFRWPNTESRMNYERGLFPDKGFQGPKYVAT